MSDVGIDKVLTEINGLRQRLSMLRDELGRANRAMSERMGQLGETLTQRVRELRDQVTTTPQNLLAIESQFSSGEMPEAEYKSQREEYRTQLTKNLRSIDEIRSLLMVLNQLEARPVTSTNPNPSGQSRTAAAAAN
jgi:phage-related minor tail protein